MNIVKVNNKMVSIEDYQCPFCGGNVVLRSLNPFGATGNQERSRYGFMPYCPRCDNIIMDLEMFDESKIRGV
jgi:endogenous inhibitor of DNA gyrase (YacG/DUF329 family)